MWVKREKRLELPARRYPAVSAYFRVWVRVWVKTESGQFQTEPAQKASWKYIRNILFEMQYPSEVSSQDNLYKCNKSLAHFMRGFVNGGGEWIRTTEVVDNRFTVCPLWPLGNSPINYEVLYKACPAFLSGRTAQFGAGERTRTPDLLITNSVGSEYLEVSSGF